MNNTYQVPNYMQVQGNLPYYRSNTMQTNTYSNGNDERLVGGFAFPFLLGGVTGAALAPAFWGPGYGYNRPNYYPPRPYPYPPRRWF